MNENAVTVEIFKQQFLERLVANDSFCGSSKTRFDTFMVTKRCIIENGVEDISC